MAPREAPKRASNYNSPLRAKQAALTQQGIIEAAVDQFGRQGWAATSLPMIAREAGVSVDTIYATFGTKSALLMAAIEVAIVGDGEEAAMADRPDFALLGRGRRAERIRAGVRYTMAVYERSVPMLRTLREAAASDEAARVRLVQYDGDRRDLTAAGMGLILARPAPDDLVDAIWALLSPEVYGHLIDERRWSSAQAEDWFVDMTKAAVARAARETELRGGVQP